MHACGSARIWPAAITVWAPAAAATRGRMAARARVSDRRRRHDGRDWRVGAFPGRTACKAPTAGRFLAVKPDETSVKAAQFIVARSAAVSTTAPALKDRVQPLWRRRRTMRSKHAMVTAVVLAVATVAVTIAPPALAGGERCDNRGRIVFTRSGDDGIPNLFSTSPCGGAVVQLTTTGAHHADISRDGRWIAYDSVRRGRARPTSSSPERTARRRAISPTRPRPATSARHLARGQRDRLLDGHERPERRQNRRPRPSLGAGPV